MRRIPLLLAALLFLAGAQAQPPVFDEAYQVRGALGDIPTTTATEPSGQWNVAQQLTVQHAAGTATNVTFHVPVGHTLVGPGCSCATFDSRATASTVTVSVPATEPAGPVTLSLTTAQRVAQAWGFALDLPQGASATDAVVVLYVPVASHLEAAAAGSSPGLSTDQSSRITFYQGTAGSPLPTPLWFAVAPGGAAVAPPASTESGFGWMELAIGAVVGIVLWAMLVQRGFVQRKGRKQVAQVAAHEAIAAAEPKDVLEAKKRALLAGLKDLELARQANELEQAPYDAAKADLKKQAVAVMRALEAGNGKEA